jgi:polysaccharide biosynthesis/export protein
MPETLPAMRFFQFATWLIALAILGACSTYQQESAVHEELVTPYRLDSGDQLRVIVFDQPDLSNTFTVDKAGFVSMPLIGQIDARNHTTEEIEHAVAAKLRNGYLRNPDVSVEVDQYRPFFAMGEVNAAGQYPYVAGMTVQAGVAIAGGYTPRADKNLIQVTRSRDGVVETARLRPTDPLMPGDTITVRERIF